MNSSAKKVDKEGAIRKFITTSNLYWNSFDFSNIKEMFFSDDEVERCTVTYGDILMCEGGAYYGRTAIWYFDYDICFQNHIHRLRAYTEISREYFYYVFYFYRNTGMMQSKGTAMPGLSSVALHSLIIPVPPLAEQKRIVAKIEELMPYIDRYEKAWSRLEEFNKRFPTDMQKSILQLAIQGKLVPQRPEEGTGEALYQSIQVEKQSLIRSGQLKKEKPLPEITSDEIPFEIPESWKWVRFSELMKSMSTGPFGSMLHKADYVDNGIPLVNPANIVKGRIVPSTKMMVSEQTKNRLAAYVLEPNMIVMGRRGEMGRCAVVTDNEAGWLCGTGSFFMAPYNIIYIRFISWLFTTPYAKAFFGGESIGTTMNNLNHKILSKMPVPLPPAAEQKRIVTKLEELLPLCERLI